MSLPERLTAAQRTRLQELSIDRSGEALGGAESAEFERLSASAHDFDFESYERTAAVLHLAGTQPTALPRDLRSRLIADGEALVAARRPSTSAHPLRSVPRREERRPSMLPWLGWVAAAAAVVLMIVWRNGDEVVWPLDARQELLAKAADRLVIAWGTTEDPAAAGASGDVVWSNERQEGYMTIRGLERNDPTVSQYQLWIFDATRTEENSVAGAGAIPIDGGLFDITSDELVIPVDAKLKVGQPTLFAVTVEKPGGVTVSKQERIVLAAAVQ